MSETSRISAGAALERFRHRRRRQRLLLFVALPVGALALVFRVIGVPACLGLPDYVFVLSILGFVILALGFSWINWRCPVCGTYLGESLEPSACRRCGTPLYRRAMSR